MAQHKTKSRTFARVKVRTVSGTKTRFDRRKPSLGVCPVTGETLKGVPRVNAGEMKKIAKSSRRPERPFGGVLSSKATRAIMKDKARKEQ
ncbi:50S ribosomal protein L34e [Candidatus Woesearchaeota archaeon]|nr:50S ribosomal protein L34e [Candidatus Woesearchaeota archaeon]MCF7901364.1 50S ribosomal protein L34e [Candidatus Woesearchaeota archaeon]MCF8013364.1 50S ribosomal protein L34e [Candidatus Woesearchaeota archaeon]